MKKVGYSLYVHKSNLSELLNKLIDEDKIRLLTLLHSVNIEYDIIKFDIKTKNISLILCPTWNTLNEPIVGDSYCYHEDGTVKIIKGGTKVYHNKWQFVSNDYKGFNVEESKKRTLEWNKITYIKDMKSKIGNKEYWYQVLKENGLSI